MDVEESYLQSLLGKRPRATLSGHWFGCIFSPPEAGSSLNQQ